MLLEFLDNKLVIKNLIDNMFTTDKSKRVSLF